MRSQSGMGRTIDRIIDHVLKRWKEWDAMSRLENIFYMKSKIMGIVLKENGSNEYKIPRSERSHTKDGPTYMPKLLSEIEDEEESRTGESAVEPQRSLSRIFEEISNQNEVARYWQQRSMRRNRENP